MSQGPQYYDASPVFQDPLLDGGGETDASGMAQLDQVLASVQHFQQGGQAQYDAFGDDDPLTRGSMFSALYDQLHTVDPSDSYGFNGEGYQRFTLYSHI